MKVDTLVRLIRELMKGGFTGSLRIFFYMGGISAVEKNESLK